MRLDLDRHGFWLAALFAVVFFAQGYWGSQHKSLTADEPVYIAAGYTYLTTGEFEMNTSHPPLMQGLVALPLLFLDLTLPTEDDDSWRRQPLPILALGQLILFALGNDPRTIAHWARLPVLLLGSGLVLAIWAWGRRLYGSAPALVAAALAAVSPNLLAHSKVATEDLGCSALMFAAVWTLWRALESDRRRDWTLWGLTTGLALVTKYTALLLGPIFVVLLSAHFWPRRASFESRRLLANVAIAALGALFVVGASYNFTFDYATYVRGVSEIYADHVGGVNLYYLMGNVYETPRWYYALAAFALKVPVSTLLLIVSAAVVAVLDRRHARASWFLLVPALVILGVSCFDRAQVGIRRILPAFPFLLLFTAQLAAARRGWRTLAVSVLLVTWTAVEALRIYPDHLSYVSVAAGGPARGPYLLDDSNVDWGQDLPALAAWQRRNPGPLKLHYFGSAFPEAYGVRWTPIHHDEFIRPEPGTYAISAHHLSWLRKIAAQTGLDTDWLTRFEPVDRAGYSIYLYAFE